MALRCTLRMNRSIVAARSPGSLDKCASSTARSSSADFNEDWCTGSPQEQHVDRDFADAAHGRRPILRAADAGHRVEIIENRVEDLVEFIV